MFKYYLLFRELVESIINVTFSLLMNLFYIKSLFHRFHRSGTTRVHILGNGPSMVRDRNTFIQSLKPGDSLLCMNMFANSSLFVEMKPNYYVLVDPLFFKNPVHVQSPTALTCRALRNKVDWALTLFIPSNFARSSNVDYIKENPYINILTIKNVPVYGGFLCVNAFLFKMGIANPLYQNVMVASLYIAIRAKFETIFLWGADHTWLENVTVLTDNKIYIRDTHFYDSEKQFERYAPDNDKMRVDISLSSYLRCFRAYHELIRYALYGNIKVLNCTSTSWIDAFERLN